MNFFYFSKARPGVVSVLLLLLMVTACAPAPTTPPPTPSPQPLPPGGNQPPAIVSLIDERLSVLPFGSTKIKCAAYDLDGDPLTFTWSATGGNLSGTGPTVIWVAPGISGTYKITVTVLDGKGGSAEADVILKVISAEKTITLNLMKEETGSVYWDGFVENDILVGDDYSNRGVRTYFSFNIVPLVRARIISARLTFFVKQVVGNPFVSLGKLHLEAVDYGASPLGQDDFTIAGSPLVKFFQALPVEVDVTSQVDYLIKGVNPRFQVRARFDRVTDSNYGNDYILFNDAVLTVIYTEE